MSVVMPGCSATLRTVRPAVVRDLLATSAGTDSEFSVVPDLEKKQRKTSHQIASDENQCCRAERSQRRDRAATVFEGPVVINDQYRNQRQSTP